MPDTKPKTPVEVASLARSHTLLAVKTLAGIAKSPKCPASARAFCSVALLERGWGKVPQSHTDADGGPIQIIIRSIIENADRMQEVTAAQPHLTIDNDDTATD